MKNTDPNKRPKTFLPRFENIPAELRPLKQWVLWKYVWKWEDDTRTKGVWSKVPFATNGSAAASDNPNTWAKFESAVLAYEQNLSGYDGIGFVFDKSGDLVGVDLDNCLHAGQFSPFALRVCEKLNTYTEVSPSGTGLHLIGRAKDLDLVRKRIKFKDNEIEVYNNGRYFTFTGGLGSEFALPVNDVKPALETILKAITPPEPNKPAPAQSADFSKLSVETRLKMAVRDEKTRRWFDGDTSDFGDDDSRADLALCRKLAYWSDGNAEILDGMFRLSKLFRAKWDERRGNQTYGEMTIQKILASQENYASFQNLKDRKVSDFDSRKTRRLSVNDLWDLAMDYRMSGEAKGVECGWSNLSRLYRPAKAQSSIFTGLPGSGKSTMLDVFCFQLAKLYGWKFTFASFETLPLQRHILNFAQIATMKPTFKFLEGAATDTEMEGAREFLHNHFHFLNPAETDFTMDGILSYVADDIKEFGIDGFVLDTFTELEDELTPGEAETKMIKRILKKQMRFAQQNNIHSWTVAHPTKPNKETFVDDGEGGKRPTLSSIGGSQNFYNKIDFGIVVHRPDKKSNRTKIYVDKVRFDVNGEIGECEFTYDKSSRCYTPVFKSEAEEKENWSF